MTQPFIGEIRWLPFSRSPSGWLRCDGSVVSIGEYDTLYTLIGTTYGGDGISTFATPDLQGRVPIHQGTGRGLSPRVIGQIAGTETVSLQMGQTGHSHTLLASPDPATAVAPANNLVLATVGANDTLYGSGAGTTQSATLGASSLTSVGAGLPHENCAPALPISAFICWAGIFPSQG
jgi:microcystin-dependent protein